MRRSQTHNLCPGVRGGKEVPPARDPEVRAVQVRPDAKRRQSPELVAVLQPQYQRVGESVRPCPPARSQTRFWNRAPALAPARFQKRREDERRDPGPRLDPRRAARSGKKPGGLGLWLRQGIRPDPGKYRLYEKQHLRRPCRFDPGPSVFPAGGLLPQDSCKKGTLEEKFPGRFST